MTKLLAVDDDEDIVELLRFSLEQQGFNVETGRNGFEALQKTKEFQPDILLLDVMMPGMDGYHVANKIMHDPLFLKKPKIVMITSRDVTRESKLMEFSGAAGTIQKPFNAAKLKELIYEIIGSS